MEFSENEYINELIRKKNSLRFKIINKYTEIFNRCLNRIRVASSSGKTDILFSIPKFIFGFIEYNYNDCCNFIIHRLRKMYMDVTNISNESDNSTIFISWYYIELNKEKRSSFK